MSQDCSPTQRATEAQPVKKLSFWHYLRRSLPLCSLMGLVMTFVQFTYGVRFGSFWGFLLRAAAMGVVLWVTYASVGFFTGRMVRWRVRDKEAAWKTHVEHRIQLALSKAQAVEQAVRLLSAIRAKAIDVNAEQGVLTARIGGFWRGTRETIELAFSEGEERSTTATVKSTALSMASFLGDDFGRNAWNVQRLCDGLVSAGATPAGDNGPACSVS